MRSLQNSERPALPDRRAARRFPIVVPVEYKAFRGRVLVREGVGRTINIGSRGILFHADAPLESDLQLELCLDWPVLQEKRAPLQLHALGQIVRHGEGQAAVRLFRSEFRKGESKGG